MAQDSTNDPVLDLSNPERVGNLNLNALTEEQILSIPRERNYLSRLRVRELRKIARDECGSGTWITHASKKELIQGTIQGHPPISAQASDRKGSAPSPSSDSRNQTDWDEDQDVVSQEYALPVAQSVIDLLTRIARKVVNSSITGMQKEINEIKRELDMSVENEVDAKEEIIEVLKEEARKSEQTAQKLSEEISDKEA